MQASTRRRVVALLCLAGAVVFWGTSFAATKTAMDGFSPMAVVWLRMALGSLVFLPFWPKVARPRYERGDWKLLALLCLLEPCLYYLFEGYAVRYTTSGQAGVISAIVPLLVAAGAWIFLKERLSPRAGVAIAISLAGVVALSLGGQAQAHAPNPLLGNMLEVAAMTSAAGWMIAVKYLSERYSPWFITGLQGLVGAIFFLPGALLSDPASWFSASATEWAAVAYLAVFVTLVSFGLYNTAVTMMPANRAALSINAIPSVALITGWLVRGETLSAVQLVACAVIVGAVILGETGEEKEPAEELATETV